MHECACMYVCAHMCTLAHTHRIKEKQSFQQKRLDTMIASQCINTGMPNTTQTLKPCIAKFPRPGLQYSKLQEDCPGLMDRGSRTQRG